MSKQYYYLVAGLPDLLFDDSKLQIDLSVLRKEFAENLSAEDEEIIRSFFYRYDNQNILNRIKDPESEPDPRGNLSAEQLDQIFLAAKEDSFRNDITGVPGYIGEFLTAYMKESPLYENKSWDLQLSELYYRYLTGLDNDYIREWYQFERDLSNLITASQCRKYEVSTENQLIGSGEIVEKLQRSQARDFGLDNDFPYLEDILKALDEEDIKEFELRLDRIRWNYLEESVFFFYFSIEKLFSYLIRVTIIERWLSLDKEIGQQLFNELLINMETSYEFPEEFTLKK